MTPERWELIKRTFEEALAADGAERRRVIEHGCAGDDELRAEVERLLHHHAAETVPPPGAAGQETAPREAPILRGSDRIGSYKVLSVLGEGGMGVVYLAEQEKPKRTVALKVIRPGLASVAMLRRFEHEAQVLGRLQHPGIAQIFEAGAANTGMGPQPYFAMEYVRGTTITEYANAHKLGTRQRLELFTKICDAVQHAHQKGVIHRDLKPGNILVDELGQPKILDFGVARAIDADIQATTLQTDIGQLIGTIPYMSPEQAAGAADDLDTRSDVYSLGVVLYELLAGRLPYDLAKKMAHEAVRVIREEEPTRLSSISRVFRGDIETIAGKALEKERARRYQSAGDLAGDVRRYLTSEPIIARPPTFSYQVGRFAKRHKGLVGGVLGVFAVLAIGIAATSVEMFRAMDAEGRATAGLVREKDLRERAQTKEREALAAVAIAERVRDLLQEVLSAADPEGALGKDATVSDALDRAAQRIKQGELRNQPLVEAAVQNSLADVYCSLHRLDEAESMARASLATRRSVLGDDHREVALSLNSLGLVSQAKGDFAGAFKLHDEAAKILQRWHGTDNAETLSALANAGHALSEGGQLEEADKVLRTAADLDRRLDTDDAAAIMNLGWNTGYRSHFDEAEKLMREALDRRRRKLGEKHSLVAEALGALAQTLSFGRADYAAAEPLLYEAVSICREIYGEDHPRVANQRFALADLLQLSGRLEAADTEYESVLALQRRLHSGAHPDIAITLSNYVALKNARRLYSEALPLAREAVEMRRTLFGDVHPGLATALHNLQATLRGLRDYEGAEAAEREAMKIHRATQGERHTQVGKSLHSLGGLAMLQGHADEASKLYAEALEIHKQALPPGDWRTAMIQTDLGDALTSLGQFPESEKLLLESHDQLAKNPAAPPTDRTVNATKCLVRLYEVWSKPDKAAEWRAKLDTTSAEAAPSPKPEAK